MAALICFFLGFVLMVNDVSASGNTFIAAVYEHNVINRPQRQYVPTRAEALGDMMKNLDIYKTQVEKAASKGADIIVFPEYGITGRKWDGNREFIKPYLETIPNPQSVKWNPCIGHNNGSDHEVQTYVSCLARNHSLYIVVNYGDIQPCNQERDPNCPYDNHYQFNTNMVFDRQGFLVARYHKEHLFFEYQFDTPSSTEIITFDTEFGTFGTFTCFDVLFKQPAINLTEDYRVGNIVFPTAWMDALPLLAAVQFHSAFAAGAGVNFLSANIHQPNERFHGSGIYTPNGAADFYYNDVSDSGKLLLAEIPIVKKSRTRKLHHVKIENYTTGDFKSDLFHDEFNFALVTPSTNQQVVCRGKLCCRLEYSLSAGSANNEETYALGAFSGLHTYEGTYYLEICTLIKCANQSHSSCGSAMKEAHTDFSYLRLAGNFSTKYVYPEILLSANNSLKVAQKGWQFSNGTLETHCALEYPMLSFSLFGRVYSLDNSISEVTDENRGGSSCLYLTILAIFPAILSISSSWYMWPMVW